MLNVNMITRYRAAVVAALDAFKECREIELEIVSQGGAGAFVSGDFINANADLDITKLTAIYTSRTAIESLCAANGNAHYTNLQKARA